MAGRRLFTAIVLALLIFSAGGCEKSAPVSVDTVVAEPGDLTMSCEISGVLTPNQTVNVTSKVSGEVQEIPYDIGYRVEAGDLVVRLDTAELDAKLLQAEAVVEGVHDQADQAKISINTATANLEMAEKEYQRTAALYKSGAVSQNQLDEMQNKVVQVKSVLESAEKQYQIATGSGLDQAQSAAQVIEEEIDNAFLYSPISGYVTARNINPGELAAAGALLMTIADTSIVRLQGEVPQDIAPLLAPGQTVPVQITAFPERTFEADITRIGPGATATGQYFPVVLSIANPGDLMPGMTGKAAIEISIRGVLLPKTAIVTENGQDYVFVVNDGTVQRRLVASGRCNASQVEIISGIAQGEAVAVSNVNVLHDGLEVVLIEK